MEQEGEAYECRHHSPDGIDEPAGKLNVHAWHRTNR